MNIETRKEKFVEEFLKLQSEEVVSRFENMLLKEKLSPKNFDADSMTKEKLNKRIHQSESDFKNGRYKTISELLAKYQ